MFTLVVDYFGTGEGRTVFIARLSALNKEDAKDKFRKSFKFFDDQAAWDYFSIGLDIYDDQNKEEYKKAAKILRNYLKKNFSAPLLRENINFSMHFHYNFS